MFKHILLPTDESELSAAAIRQGVLFAKSIGAKVTGLCVMPLHYKFLGESLIPTERTCCIRSDFTRLPAKPTNGWANR